MTTYEEFIKKIEEIIGYKVPKPEKNPDTWSRGRCELYRSVGLWNNQPSLLNVWHVGGSSGASCWGGTPEPYSTGTPEPEWDALNEILDHFCPNITYLKFRGIMAKVESGSQGEGDYYGNETMYSIRALPLRTLYDHMVEKGLLT